MLSRIKAMFIDFITCGQYHRASLEVTGRLVLINTLCLTGITLIPPFGTWALLNGYKAIAISDYIGTAFLLCLMCYLRKTRNYQVASIFGSIIMATVYLVVFFFGPPEMEGYLWSITLPLLVMYLLGRRVGTIVTFSYFSLITLIITCFSPYVITQYSTLFLVRYGGVYLAIWLFALFSDFIDAVVQERMKLKNLELEDKEEMFRLAFENAKDAIIWIDYLTKCILNCNLAAESLVGKGRQELLGRNMSELFPEGEVGKEAISTFLELIEQGFPSDFETLFLSSNQEEKHVSISAALTQIGGIRIIQSIVRDITNQKEALEEKKRLENQLQRSHRMEAIGQLAGGVAHDFNNILGAISGYAEMIGAMTESTNAAQEKVGRYAKTILAAADRAQALTAQLLAFARRGKLATAPIEINQTIAEALSLLEHSISKEIIIERDFSETPLVINGDMGQIQNVIINLALNSQKAMPSGGKLCFKTSSTFINDELIQAKSYPIVPGPYLLLTVSDTGHGMDEMTREHIFEPFFTSSKDGHGTGLGLASVYGTVKNHNGYVDVESVLNEGTRFSIYLPLSDQEPSSISKEVKELSNSREGKILIVDDEVYIQEMIVEMLEDMGYEAVSFSDSQEALDWYRRHYANIDLVILDIMMPVMNGYALFMELQKINPSIEALVISGFTIEGGGRKILDSGAKSFLQKPFKQEQLAIAISSILDRD